MKVSINVFNGVCVFMLSVDMETRFLNSTLDSLAMPLSITIRMASDYLAIYQNMYGSTS